MLKKITDNLWDGKDQNGTALPENGYLWVINVSGTGGQVTTHKGTLTIIREN